MYLAVVLILWSWALGFESKRHANYAILMMVVFYVRVVLFEDPWLSAAHRHPDSGVTHVAARNEDD